MKKNEPLTQIMSTGLQTIHGGEPVSKLRAIFESGGIHHVPVVSGEKLIGIVSWHDFARISFGEFGNQSSTSLDQTLDHLYTIQDVMVSDPLTIQKSGTIRDAARLLGTNNFNSLPVVEGDKLVGIVTSTDLIRYLADQ